MELVCLDDSDLRDFLRVVARLGLRCRVVCAAGSCRLYIDRVPSSLRVSRGIAAWIGYLLGRCRVVVPVPLETLPGIGSWVAGGSGGGLCFDVVGGGSVCLPVDVLWRHVGVFGATGSGKSTTVAYIVSRIAELGLLALVFDWHGEYGGLLEGYGARFYEYSYPGLPRLPLLPEGDVDVAVDVLSDVLALSDPQALLLIDLLESIRDYCVSGELGGRLGLLARIGERPLYELRGICRGGGEALQAFYRLIRSLYNSLYVVESRGEREAWAALLRRLRLSMRELGLFSFESGSLEDVIQLPEEGIVVFNVSGIRSARSRALYTLLFARLLYEEAYRRGLGVGVVLVFEEAHNLCKRGSAGVLSTLAQEARKYRIGMIVVDQSPSLLEDGLLSNINTVIMHRVHSSSDLEALKHVAPMLRELRGVLPALKPGEAILASTALPTPVPIIISPGARRGGGSR